MKAYPFLQKVFRRTAKVVLLFFVFLMVLHIILYLVSNHQIKKIEIKKIEDFLTEIPGKFVKVNGDRVHFIEKGKGTPVVFLHGFAGSTYNWEQTIYNDLPDNRRTICIDLFGMGFSERRENFQYDFPFWADQLYNTMNAMGILKASVVGFSLGGSVAVDFAAKYPEQVDRLVLISSLSPFDVTDLPVQSLIYFIPGGGEIMLTMPSIILSRFYPEKEYNRYRQTNSIIGTRQALLTFMKEVPDFQGLFFSYPKIQAKTLLIHGERDTVIPLSAIKRVVPRIPSCRAVYLENVGHWVLGEAKTRLVDELSVFLY
jgi:2-hydroxy-6-oxo-octa-2,4-dienoate hydrolase